MQIEKAQTNFQSEKNNRLTCVQPRICYECKKCVPENKTRNRYAASSIPDKFQNHVLL